MSRTCYILEWNLSLKRAFVEKAEEKGWHDIFCMNEDFGKELKKNNLHFILILELFLLKSY